jgi:putative SOS response-associated peptidase YedK
MCARYEVEDAPAKIAEELDATLRDEIAPRRTIAPTDVAPVLVLSDAQRLLVPMKFGWPPSRPKERIHLNTRSESAAREGDSRDALTERRCLVPAHAFHEWSGPKGARLHHLFAPPGQHELITMAGLYVAGEDGGPARFVILTTAASREVRPFHHRMPLVVPPNLRTRWITVGAGEDPAKLLAEVRKSDAPALGDREAEEKPK